MGINWFEGGRRIVLLLVALIMIGGAVYVIASNGDDRVVIETSSPNKPLLWTLNRCSYPDFAKEWTGEVEFKPGDPRTVVACLRARENGKIAIGYGEPQRMVLPAKNDRKAMPFTVRRELDAQYYSDEVEAYAATRMRNFKFTSDQWDAIKQGQWKISVVRFFERVNEALPWVVGLIIGTVALSFVLGWLIRGFAGIASGRDFRGECAASTIGKANAAHEWAWIAISFWLLAGGIGWVVLNSIGATTGPVGKVVGKAVSFVGMLLMMVVFFGLAAAGGHGLQLLTKEITKREGKRLGDKAILAFSIANGLILAAASIAINTYTIVGNWTDALDQWSRSNGLKDFAMVALFVACLLWPYLVLYAVRQMRGEDASVEIRGA